MPSTPLFLLCFFAPTPTVLGQNVRTQGDCEDASLLQFSGSNAAAEDTYTSTGGGELAIEAKEVMADKKASMVEEKDEEDEKRPMMAMKAMAAKKASMVEEDNEEDEEKKAMNGGAKNRDTVGYILPKQQGYSNSFSRECTTSWESEESCLILADIVQRWAAHGEFDPTAYAAEMSLSDSSSTLDNLYLWSMTKDYYFDYCKNVGLGDKCPNLSGDGAICPPQSAAEFGGPKYIYKAHAFKDFADPAPGGSFLRSSWPWSVSGNIEMDFVVKYKGKYYMGSVNPWSY